jgi:perosamine synthetase
MWKNCRYKGEIMISIAQPQIGKEEIEAVTAVLQSGRLTQGPNVKKFEQEFADYIGVDHAIAVNSGTSALLCALLAGKTRGEIITTPFSFISSVSTIVFAQCKPVFVDIKDDCTIDEEVVAEYITSDTGGILPVHLYGNPCTMDTLVDLAEDHDLQIIEDACQAHGAEFSRKKVGSFGTGCFSFYPTKNMTTAEGGMVVTSDDATARRCRLFRNIGQKSAYEYEFLGYNFRMSELCAAMGRVQLNKLDTFNNIRINNAEYLSQHLDSIKGIVVPCTEPIKKHVFHQYTITVTEEFPLSRDQLASYLRERGIGCRVYYPYTLHQLSLFSQYTHDNLTKSEQIAGQVLSLPVHPGVTQKELEYIAKTIGDVI